MIDARGRREPPCRSTTMSRRSQKDGCPTAAQRRRGHIRTCSAVLAPGAWKQRRAQRRSSSLDAPRHAASDAQSSTPCAMTRRDFSSRRECADRPDPIRATWRTTSRINGSRSPPPGQVVRSRKTDSSVLSATLSIAIRQARLPSLLRFFGNCGLSGATAFGRTIRV